MDGGILLKGFTLSKLFTVVAIAVILAGFLIISKHITRRKTVITRTKTMIASLEAAIAMFKTDMGDYPESGNANLVNQLSNVDYANSKSPNYNLYWNGPYIKFKNEDLGKKISQAVVLDPWGNPYVYIADDDRDPRTPPYHNSFSYDLYSKGANGRTAEREQAGEEKDDINNW